MMRRKHSSPPRRDLQTKTPSSKVTTATAAGTIVTTIATFTTAFGQEQ